MGHTVHEGDDSLMSFCKTSGSGSPGPFFLATFTKEQPQQGGLAGAAEVRRCRVGTRRDYLSKVQSVDQRMRVGMRCRLSPTADVPSHRSGQLCANNGLSRCDHLTDFAPYGKYTADQAI